MKLKIFRKNFLLKSIALVLPTIVCFSSCDDGFVFEKLEDCKETHQVRFRYDMNLKWANAFHSEVKSVHLYAFDEDGKFVAEFTEKGDVLSDENYRMEIDLPVGNYHLVAWGGLDNDTDEESFSVTSMSQGESLKNDLSCKLNHKTGDLHPFYSDTRLHMLYHGSADIKIEEATSMNTIEHTIPMVKNTNHVRVILQQLSGNDLDATDFDFRLEDRNGHMAFDNSIVEDAEKISYLPWKKMTGTAGIGKDDISEGTRGIINVNGVIADITTPRMMENRRNDMILTVTNHNTGKTVARIPFIDYALLSKDYYEEAYGHKMSDQELLDREDEYIMTLFLDENKEWLNSYIMIHSWRIVLHHIEVE